LFVCFCFCFVVVVVAVALLAAIQLICENILIQVVKLKKRKKE